MNEALAPLPLEQRAMAERMMNQRMPATQKAPPPSARSHKIVHIPSIPQLPNLVSQPLINQQGFDVDFGEHGRTVAVVWDSDQWRKSTDCSETRLENNHSGPGMAVSSELIMSDRRNYRSQ